MRVIERLRGAVLRAVSLAVIPAAAGFAAESGWKPVWGKTGVALTATDSMKWAVRLMPDGDGGTVAAWEENRGRKACCRDTRDVYVQRLDRRGAKVWNSDDIRVAGAEEGEECLGLFPWRKGGFLVIWRQGNRLIRASQIGPDGVLSGGEGLKLAEAEADAEFEFNPGSCGAPGGYDASVLLAWTEAGQGGAGAVQCMSLYSRELDIEKDEPEIIAEGSGLHGAAVIPCREAGWLVVYWRRAGAGSELFGRWVGPDGSPSGKSILLGRDLKRRWINAEGAPGKTGEAFVAWSAVNPDSPDPEHDIRLVRVTRTSARAVSLGRAGTRVLYVPKTLVTVRMEGMTSSSTYPATGEDVTWRRSFIVVPDGEEGCLAGRSRRGMFLLRRARPKGARGIDLSPEIAACKTGNADCPELLEVGGRFAAWWRERSGGGARVVGRFIRLGRVSLEAEGGVFEIAAVKGEFPGGASAVCPSRESAVFAWMGILEGKAGVLRMQMLGEGP